MESTTGFDNLITWARSHWLPLAVLAFVLWQAPENERGALLYELGDKLKRGPVIDGEPENVKIPIETPPGGRPFAFLHEHPSGVSTPSEKDKAAAKKHNLRVITVGENESTIFDPADGSVSKINVPEGLLDAENA